MYIETLSVSDLLSLDKINDNLRLNLEEEYLIESNKNFHNASPSDAMKELSDRKLIHKTISDKIHNEMNNRLGKIYHD